MPISAKDASAPSQVLALAAFRQQATIHEENRQLALSNLERLREFMSAHDQLFDWHEPAAGVVAFPKLLAGSKATPLHEQLVDHEGVLLAPGRLFGAPDEYFRIGFGHANFKDGLERVTRHLASPRASTSVPRTV